MNPKTQRKMISQKLKEKIYESIGAASTCWENMKQTGEFDSIRARKIGDDLFEAVAKEMDENAIAQRLDAIGFPKPQPLSVERISPPKIVDAQIVVEFNYGTFNKNILEKLKSGFVPHGSLAMDMFDGGYCIAILMVKYE